MDNTVYQEKHSLSGGVLLKWRMGLHRHPPLTGIPMMMMTMVRVFHFVSLGCGGYLQNEFIHTFYRVIIGWGDVTQ